jgi:hypothetical protein
VKNASGNFTLPTPANVAIALKKATLNKDRTQNLSGVYTNKDKAAYPLSSYSYMIVPTTGINPDKAKVLGQFMVYFACEGQQKASVLGYSPLPENLVKAVFDAVKGLQGADAPPELSAKTCANPTLSGDLGEGANSAGKSTGATTGGGTSETTGTTDGTATDTGTTTNTDGNTTSASGGTVISDETKYAQMQPVEVTLDATGVSTPSRLALILFGLILVPPVARLSWPLLKRLANAVRRRIRLPRLWVYHNENVDSELAELIEQEANRHRQ